VTCDENGECLNTEGSYSCGCKSGYTGDGYNCTSTLERGSGNNITTIITQISMSVLGTVHVMIMQTVMIVMVVTGVSVCQDSREMDTTVEVIVQRKIHSSVE
jgi:hypothetical protein